MKRYRFKYFLFFLLFLFSTKLVFSIDSDKDGLSDDVEQQLGSNQFHKDIFVEVDWLVVNGKSMKPRGNFVQIAQSIFDSAPLSNPDGTPGVTLHVQLSQGIPVSNGVAVAGDWNAFDAVKQKYFTPTRWNTHHYCLFIDAIILPDGSATVSGISRNGPNIRVGASDFVVAMGPNSGFFNYPTSQDFKWSQVGTFVHELGHNLGLKHGGRDSVSYKPNNLSLMSYAYQMLGIPITYGDGSQYYRYDYSRVEASPINEKSVNEFAGIGWDFQIEQPGVVFGARWCFGPGHENCSEIFDASSGVDFDLDGKLTSGYKLDLNQDNQFTGLSSGTYDWYILNFNGGLIGKNLKAQRNLPAVTSLTCLKSSELPRMIHMNPKAKRGTFKDTPSKN